MRGIGRGEETEVEASLICLDAACAAPSSPRSGLTDCARQCSWLGSRLVAAHGTASRDSCMAL